MRLVLLFSSFKVQTMPGVMGAYFRKGYVLEARDVVVKNIGGDPS